jgi:hypothetical protein
LIASASLLPWPIAALVTSRVCVTTCLLLHNAVCHRARAGAFSAFASRPEVRRDKSPFPLRRNGLGVPWAGGSSGRFAHRPTVRRVFPDCEPQGGGHGRSCAGDGYGIEIGLLIDIYQRHGLDAIVEVDLVEVVHRNRRLHSLGRHADDVLDAVLHG